MRCSIYSTYIKLIILMLCHFYLSPISIFTLYYCYISPNRHINNKNFLGNQLQTFYNLNSLNNGQNFNNRERLVLIQRLHHISFKAIYNVIFYPITWIMPSPKNVAFPLHIIYLKSLYSSMVLNVLIIPEYM